MNYLKTEWKRFIKSWKLGYNFLYTSLFDLIFFTIATVSLSVVGKITNTLGQNVDTGLLASQQALTAAAEPQLIALYGQLKGLVVGLVISILGLFGSK